VARESLRLRFRAKLFLALGLLVATALGAAIVLVRSETERRVRDDFGERFERTLAAFRQLQALRRRTVADEVNALAIGNPLFRTVLSAASVAEDDLGFGGAPSRDEQLRDANLRLRSLLPSLAGVSRHDVFVVTNAAAELIYTRVAPERFGDSLASMAPLAEAAEGEAATALWSRASDLPAEPPLAPVPPPRAVYEVVAEPVVFGDELHGLVLVGVRIDRDMLDAMRAISGLHVALLGDASQIVATLPQRTREALVAQLAEQAEVPSAAGVTAAREWQLAGERWLVARAPIVPGEERVSFLLLASIDAELAFLRALEESFVALGAAILALALGLAFLLARGVARPVAELARAAERVGAGDLDTRVDVTTGDELEQLGSSFNRMVEGLRERDRIRRTFERHVSREVVAELLRHPEALAPSGTRRTVSVLFSDLEGFTSLSEQRAPEEVLACLNDYFEVLCGAVLEAGGTVNELLGDGVLASFGAPIAHPDHATRACRAALLASQRLAALAVAWQAQGRPPLRWRIGIHTGEVVIGEMGTEERTKYGVIGDAVNLASRLEGANKALGTTILVSDATRDATGDAFVFREIDSIRVAGRAQPLRVFEPLGAVDALTPGQLASRDRYEAALAAYRARDFAGAVALFETAGTQDAPSRALCERARRMATAPPPAGWDAVLDVKKPAQE
jgi:class 3 adenylate cyclase